VILFLLFPRVYYDDPFITFRYADNLAHGLGFVYNLGERILSTTTPLFTLLLALFGCFWTDLPSLANLIGTLSLACGALFIWDMARTWNAPVVGWVGLLLYPTFTLGLIALGSEIPLYVAFCLGAFAFYVRGRYGLAGLCAALAVLTRPDGILVAVILTADYLMRVRRPILWSVVLMFLGLVAAWFVFAWIYFGSPFPITLAVKQHQGDMAISTRFAPGLLTIAEWYASWKYGAELLLALIGISALGRARQWILFLAWPVAYFGAYTFLGVSFYPWYYVPLVPGFLVLVGLGLSVVSTMCFAVLQKMSRVVQLERDVRFFLYTSGALAIVLFTFQAQDVLSLRERPDQRFGIYKAVGEWLVENTLPTAKVGALEVGIIGYYARRSMIDFAGLIQPLVAMQMRRDTTYEDTALYAVERYRPDFLVLQDRSFERLEQGYVAQSCVRVKHFSGAEYHYSADLSVYSCR
jgi:hypothetical protein